ncbi:hypothetical protein HHK36_004445 [Tetracentron sinense]|uniref:VHS domain-containing protein n=1 Tax=Tetracentron sinense TaxID=13715 RepID=A0A835DTG2_TETSI|nr:hypothetical protein HHK36_004445 [Tetracentron sinense]
MLMNNFGEHIHGQVIDTGLLPILVKIVKKKSDLPVREKIFLLLDATQTSLGGASGKFPQYYTAYYDLVIDELLGPFFLQSAGVEFPQRPRVLPSDHPTSKVQNNNLPSGKPVSPKHEGVAQQADPQMVPESSIIQKASAALEVLKEVLDAINTQCPEGAKDEFTLDLVEQCSFQKQRVMHLVMTSQYENLENLLSCYGWTALGLTVLLSLLDHIYEYCCLYQFEKKSTYRITLTRDEKVVSKAIELNEQLQKVLARHDALLSVQATSTATHFDNEEEEEEAERLFRRIRKGKACVRPEDEDHLEQPLGLFGSIQAERLHRPLIRPLCLEPQESKAPPPAVDIPPPPAKHIERERFFQEKKVDSSTLAGQMRGLSVHSRNASSSHSESIDSSD